MGHRARQIPDQSHVLASGRVVFDAEMDVVYATPSGERAYRYPIITIENGKVAEHRDYTDFKGMIELAN